MENVSFFANQFKVACEKRLKGNATLFSRVMNEVGPEGLSGLINDGFDEVFGMAEQFLGGPKQDVSAPQTRVAERYARIFLRTVNRDELVALAPHGFGDEGVAEAFERRGLTALAQVSRAVRQPNLS